MKMFAKHRIVAVLISVFFAQQIQCSGLGKCPKINYMKSFNVSRFTGRWYEIERSFYLVQIISSCISVDLRQNARGSLEVDVKSTNRWTDTTLTVSEGIASPTKRHHSILSYKVDTNLPKMMRRYLPGAGIYQILDTDYDNYALLWSCTNYGLAHTDLIWIWGRRREITADRRIRIYEQLDEVNLDSERLILPMSVNCSEF